MSTPSAEAEFREAYEQTSRKVYAYLRRHTDADTAETVLSEVYLKAWRHWDGLRGELLPWLLVAARTALVDHHRAAGRRRRLAGELFALHRDVVVAGVDDLAVDRVTLREALDALSPDDREALLLVGWDGLSHADAARVAGCSTAAFTARVNRARKRFGSQLTSSRTGARSLTGRSQS